MSDQPDRLVELDRFLDALLTAESGLDPARAGWYARNWDEPVLRYWRVARPGEVERHPATGAPFLDDVSPREYFERLGVKLKRADVDPERVAHARYSVLNAWGFVGYQLGEALLIETGHYKPAQVRVDECVLATYYSGDLRDGAWAGGVRQRPHSPWGAQPLMMATHVNLWRGAFTGLDGAVSLDALRSKQVQQSAMKRILRHNAGKILSGVASRGACVKAHLNALSTELSVPVTSSGLLAAAHLCGVDGVLAFLFERREASDETGSSLVSYLIRFSGWDPAPSLLGEEWRGEC